MQTEDEDADIEAALDTSDEMSVGEALRRRRSHKEKRSIAKRHGPSKLGAGGRAGRACVGRLPRRRTRSVWSGFRRGT